MKNIRPPRVSNAQILRTLTKSRPELRHLLPDIRLAYNNYLGQKAHPAHVAPLDIPASFDDELERLYSGATKKDGLDWINVLRDNPKLAYCPMCGNQGNSDIEHYLPKSSYPEFSFFSFNLIPSCTDCNRTRGIYANFPGTTAPLLHPYFDKDILNTPIVIVRIQGTIGKDGEPSFVAPAFEIESLLDPSHELAARLKRHLSKCIHSAAFNRFVTDKWVRWRRKAARFQSLADLKKRLAEELSDYEATAGLNSWSSAFFRGLCCDEVALDWLRRNPCG